jgi:hypothetical protein
MRHVLTASVATRTPFLIVLILCAGLASAQAQSADTMRVPSGALSLLDVPLADGGAFAALRAIRVLYWDTHSDNVPPRVLELQRLLLDLDRLEREAARTGARGLSLDMSRTATERDALQDTLEAAGLRLREQRRVFRVEARTGGSDVELRARLTKAGIDTAAILKRLNAGETVHIAPAVVELPLPLPIETWTSIFEQPVPPPVLFSAIIRNREASLLYYGVQAMTADTRAYLAKTPALLRSLYGNAAAVAAYGGAFRVGGDGRAVVPGGADAEELWEALVDAPVTRPDRFGRQLFERDGGRLAYFADALWALDQSRLRFALGMSIRDRGIRATRFRALYDVFAQIDPSWAVAEQPFSRPSFDAALLLSVVEVNDAGELAPPAYRRLWDRASGSIDVPGPGDREMRDPAEDGMVDAADLARLLNGALSPVRRLTIERVSFAQRNFADATTAEQQDVLVALRAYGRFPAAMLALERIGVRTPALFAQVARRALTLEAEEPARAVPLLAQFQASLAVLDRMARTGAVSTAVLEQLVTSLTAITFTDGRYEGRVAAWLRTQLLPTLPASSPGDSMEDRLLDALTDRVDVTTQFVWEGDSFIVDFSGPRRDLAAIRVKQGGNPLDRLLVVYDHATALARERQTLEEIKSSTAALRTDAAKLAPARPWPDAPDAIVDVKKIVDRAVRDLGGIRRERDVSKASEIMRPVIATLDYLLGETLVALAYAPALDESAGLPVAADVSHRHLFGFATVLGDAGRLVGWRRPTRAGQLAVGDALTGSLLGLDLGLAHKRLRRLASEGLPEAPKLNGNDRETMTATVALLNPRLLKDAEQTRIGTAVARGRMRVADSAAVPPALDALAVEGGLTPVRRQLLAWTARHEPARLLDLFSISELFRLGGGQHVDLHAWGTSHESLIGCFCLRFPDDGAWALAVDRPNTGQMGARLGDLNLQVAALLADLGVPAALFPSVMALATQDYIDSVPAVHTDDWAAMAGRVAAISRERMEDYVSAVIADGPVRRSASEGAR